MKQMRKMSNAVFASALIALLTLGLGACSSMDSDATDQQNMTRTKAQAGPGFHQHTLMAEYAGMEGDAIMLETKTGMETAQLDAGIVGAARGLDKGDRVVVDYSHENDVMIVRSIREATTADMRDREIDDQVMWDDDDGDWSN